MQEKRSHARAQINVPVTCEAAGGASINGVAKDISVGGVYIQSSQQLPFNTAVTVVGQLPGSSKQSRLPGVVRWTKENGFGVQFGLLGAVDTHLITKLMGR